VILNVPLLNLHAGRMAGRNVAVKTTIVVESLWQPGTSYQRFTHTVGRDDRNGCRRSCAIRRKRRNQNSSHE
jgi:hypothetical protein